jgi:hypothetical protein
MKVHAAASHELSLLATALPAGWEKTWWTAFLMCNTPDAKQLCEAMGQSRKKHDGKEKARSRNCRSGPGDDQKMN